MIAKTIPKALTNWEQATNQEPSTNQATKDERLIQKRSDYYKASNSSESG